MASELVKIIGPAGAIKIRKDQLAVYERRGWKRAEPDTTATPARTFKRSALRRNVEDTPTAE
jgi:hypothetical protein